MQTDVTDSSWPELRAKLDHHSKCIEAIEATARRLGVDPVAFAEACQDGELLSMALIVCRDAHKKRKGWAGEVSIVAGMLNALKARKAAYSAASLPSIGLGAFTDTFSD